MRSLSASLASLIAAGTCVAAVAPTQADPAAALRVLADEYWAAYVERYPEVATYQGVTRPTTGSTCRPFLLQP